MPTCKRRAGFPFTPPLHSLNLGPSSDAMRRRWLNFVAVTVLVVGCVGPPRTASRATRSLPPEPYVRIAGSDSNHIALQIAAREFLPTRRGEPVVWLTGVSHIGESSYYAALQAHLDAQTLVLFEGVGAAEEESSTNNDHTELATQGTEAAPANEGNRGSLQSAMATALGLVFQLDAIDYRRGNFRNSDLSISQLRELMAQQEAGSTQAGASESFENLMELMQGSSWFDWLLQAALRCLGTSPKFQALGRLALIDLLGQLQGDPSRLEGLPPDLKQLLEVLLQRRNEKVISDLKSDLPTIGRHGSIAIFFGTGHMPDLEKRLCSQLKYRPGRELWYTAFDVDLGKAKISSQDRAFIDNFVKWQLAEASHPATK